jgi:hypothetical protein
LRNAVSRRVPRVLCARHGVDAGGESPLRALMMGTASRRQLRRCEAGWGESGYRKKAAACLQLLAHQHLPLVMPVCIRQTAPIRVPDKRQLEQRFTLELFRYCKLVRHEPRLEFRQGCKSVNVSHRVDCGLTALSPE